MVRSGRVDLKEISVYLGHRSVVVTERVYVKFKPTLMKEASSPRLPDSQVLSDL